MSDFQIPVLAWLVGVLADVMRGALQFCYQMSNDFGFPSYGIAIIVLTVIIKVALLPLAVKQIRSMKGMQELQPKIQAIQKNTKATAPRSARKCSASTGKITFPPPRAACRCSSRCPS